MVYSQSFKALKNAFTVLAVSGENTALGPREAMPDYTLCRWVSDSCLSLHKTSGWL